MSTRTKVFSERLRMCSMMDNRFFLNSGMGTCCVGDSVSTAASFAPKHTTTKAGGKLLVGKSCGMRAAAHRVLYPGRPRDITSALAPYQLCIPPAQLSPDCAS